MIDSSEDIPYADARIESLRPVEIGEIADAVWAKKSDKNSV